jgi:putative ABC transport system permease protein
MFKNYIKIAVRQLRKQKMYSTIKIGGFSLGIAACMLIALFIRDELSYDKDYPQLDKIYRVVGNFKTENGTIEKWTSFPPPMAKALLSDFPQVENAGRLMPNTLFWGAGSNYLKIAGRNENIYEQGFTYADQQVLDILKIQMVYGNRSAALTEPFTMVISRKKAEKYFPGTNPVGKMMLLNDNKDRAYRITGVMEDFPKNSHLSYDFLLTLADIEFWDGEQPSWRSSNYPIYLHIKPGSDIEMLQKKMTSRILSKYIVPSMLASGDKVDKVNNYSIDLQSIKDIHLRSSGINDGLSHGDIRFVWLFGGIACFILIIACINFINLSTAKSANRAKEVGLRKVVGCRRNSLVKQFLTESFLFSFLSFFAGLLLAWILLPYFNHLSGKSLTLPWTEWWMIPSMILGAGIIGLLAGLYPSFYLSSFNPASVLKGELSRGVRSSLLRNGLVIFQFTISIILIIGTFVIYSQMKYILNKDVGFDKDQVVLIQGTNTLGNKVKTFKDELLKISRISSVTISDYLPVKDTKRNGNTIYKENRTRDNNGVNSQVWIADHDYARTMGIKIVQGRYFSPDMPTDTQAVVINQTLAKGLNLKNPIGERITTASGTYTVIGVVQDFNYESMRDNIQGMCLLLGNSSSIVSVKINSADMKKVLSSISAVWKNFAPDQSIRYTFLDESFANMYADVQRMGSIFTSFAILAIIIACLGLFALSAFIAEQRNKEIGVRKVLGASVQGITVMLSKDFIKLVIISIILASPIAWWAMSKWLEDYTYRITISWWMFASTGLLVIAIAFITVSFQAIKAALMNPVKSLRSE